MRGLLTFKPACQSRALRLDWAWFWKGGEPLGASQKRKVRTPKGAMPRNPGLCGRDTRGRKVERPFDGQCHRKSNRRSLFDAARVKRCGKSAPREAQATRHGKPHRVQGQIGNPERPAPGFAKVRRIPGIGCIDKWFSPLARVQTEFGLQPFQNQFPKPVGAFNKAALLCRRA